MLNMVNLGPPVARQDLLGDKVLQKKDLAPKDFAKELDQKGKPKEFDVKQVGVKAEAREPSKNIKEVEKENGKQPSKQKVMLEFMDSFESEFNIEPTRLVGAMASLDPLKANLKPEQTAHEVIAQLNLDPEDQIQAEQMYLQMLMQTQNTAEVKPFVVPNEQMVVDSAVVPQNALLGGAAIASAVATKEMLQQSALPTAISNQSVAPAFRMNEDILTEMMADANPLDADEIEPLLGDLENKLQSINQAIDGLDPEIKSESSSVQQLAKNIAEKPNVKLQQVNAYKDTLDQSQPLSQKIAQLDPQQIPELKEMKSFDLQKQNGLISENAQASVIVQENTARQESAFGQNSQQQASGGQAGDGQAQVMSARSAESSEKNNSDFKMPDLSISDMSSLSPKAQATLTGAAAAATMTPMGRSENLDANIQKIMNQAQIMIKDGGGEMKVRLSPEGMGEVQLKVILQDGKVSLQMATESKEAKSLLESSLGDLKKSLASHSISLDNIKVDIAPTTASESSQQKDMNFQDNTGREQARQFLNDFREQNMGQRQALFDGPQFGRQVRTDRQPESLEPITSSSTKKYGVSGTKGSGLNLVA